MNIEENSRVLFMKYALPCAGTLVRRGKVSREYIDRLIDIVKNNGKIPKDAEKIFVVAFSACSLIAMDSGKSSIDSDIIREYFLLRHDDVIDRRYEEMGDFDPEACRTRSGIVGSVGDDFAVVNTPLGKGKYRTDFVSDIRRNDVVVTHWNFVVEKIDKNTVERMKVSKKSVKLV